MNPEHNDTPSEEATPENKTQPSTIFNVEGKPQAVSFVETTHVVDGVDCDVYTFPEDDTKDLGIIKIDPGMRTPLQKVLLGEKTVEGYVSGKGKLTVTKPDGTQAVFNADGSEPVIVTVNIGETMQWEAAPDSNLVAFELCIPPYEDGRFENIG